mmetsp:Transcript_54280/g.115829  ORF Transcript_54280/g.115829 Transcript_54280/m.115829 type:complete len:251 (+) Transcript_54280:152-904(+)
MDLSLRRRLCMLLLLLHAAALSPWLAEAASLPAWKEVSTSLGSIKLRELGPHDGPLAICIHGAMNNEFIRGEWDEIALKLAEAGYHVLIPNFHSGPKTTTPRHTNSDDVRALIVDLAFTLDGFVPSRYKAVAAPKVFVLGKSWGGRQAAEIALLPQVVGAALVAPAIGEKEAGIIMPKIKGEVVLCMAKDDPVVPFSRAAKFLQNLPEKQTFIEAASGGHKVLPEYTLPILALAERIRDAFSHDEVPPEL